MKKTQAETGHKSKILIGVMILSMLFLVNFAVAEELLTFDNVKSYDAVAQKVTIENTFGMGRTIADVKLDTDLINYVPEGYVEVARFTINSYDDEYSNALEKVELYNKDDYLKLGDRATLIEDRRIDYKLLTYEEVWVEAYNETKGYFETREKFVDFDPAKLTKGKYTIGLFTTTKRGDHVEFIPTYFGVKLNEYATWIVEGHGKSLSSSGGSKTVRLGTGILIGAKDIQIRAIHKKAECTPTTAFVQFANGTVMKNATFSGNWANFSAPYPLLNATYEYEVSAWSGGGGFTAYYLAVNGNFPVAETDFTWANGNGLNIGGWYDNAHNDNVWCIIAIEYSLGEDLINTTATLNAPANASNFSTSQVTFNFTGYTYNAGARIVGSYLIIDGIVTDSNTTSMANGTTYVYTKTLTTGWHNWTVNITDSNSSNIFEYRYFNITIYPPTVTPQFPYLNSNWSNTNIEFNATVTDDYTLQNVTLYIDGILNETNTSGIQGQYRWNKILLEGNHNWSVLAYDNDSNPTQSATIPFAIDISLPVLSTSGITNKYNSTFPINLTWSLFNADVSPNSCWYYTSENATNISVTCNSSTITNFTSDGLKTIYYFGNHSAEGYSNGSATLYVGYYPYTQNTDKTNVGSGDSVVFTLYVNGTNVNSLWPETTATINFNGTVYTPDATDRTNQNYTKFTKTIYMTIGNTTGANTPYNWSYNIKNTTASVLNVTTSNQTIKVYVMSVFDCNGVGGRYILNASIKDEEQNTLINATLNSTTIEVDLTISSRANTSATWNFSKKWINNETVRVCVPANVLIYSQYKIDFTIGYKADGYVQEFYYMDNGTIDSTNYFNSYTTNPISLYDLESADSTTFLFKFKDENNLEVDDALIHVYRKYIGDGIFREVERAEQDNNGETHVHLVEEDVIYYFMITQYGHIIYTSANYNAKCLSTPCQIELSASPDFTEFPTDYDKVNGTVFTLTSSKSTRTVTLNYVSNSSKVVNLSVFKVIDGQTISYIDTTALTGTSGTLTLNIPLSSGNETFFASIFSDGTFVRSEWVDMRENAQDYFGTTGAILGGLLVLTLIFMAISEGVVLIIIGVVAIIIIGAMQLVDLSWLAIISIICAGALIIWKLTQGGNKR